jgi:hypothetical protein
MALSAEECFHPKTLKRLENLIEDISFPIGYAKILEWSINPGMDNNKPYYKAVLGIYFSKESRDKKVNNSYLYEIGGVVSEGFYKELCKTDHRNLLYKVTEFLIHFSFYTKKIDRNKISDESELRLKYEKELKDLLHVLDLEDFDFQYYTLYNDEMIRDGIVDALIEEEALNPTEEAEDENN